MVCIDCGKETSNFRYYADVDVEICDGCVEKAARNHVMVLLAFKRKRWGNDKEQVSTKI